MDRMSEGMTPQSESIAALARRYGKSRTTIYAWIRAGKIKLNSFGVVLSIEEESLQTSAKSVQSERPRRKPSGRASESKQDAAFSNDELTAMVSALDAGLADGTIVPFRNPVAAVRLLDIAANIFRCQRAIRRLGLPPAAGRDGDAVKQIYGLERGALVTAGAIWS